MLINSLVAGLALVASTPVLTANAAHLPFSGGKRSLHSTLHLDKLRRTPEVEVRSGGAANHKNKKGKRLVRRAKRSVCPSNTTQILGSASMSSSDLMSPSSTLLSATSVAAAASASASPSPSSSSDWKLVTTYAGSNFFDNFQFWQWADPTHGDVTFLDAGDAWNNGLVSINDQGYAMMNVETTNNLNRPRQSIRISGNLVWTGGLVLMDAHHMPYGCGTWPAWWQNGPNWPQGGEIDILEGVNAFTQNQVSLHTGVGCNMPTDSNNNQKGTFTTGSYNSYDCSSSDTSNQGCGVRDQVDANTYGQQFNLIGGGVYAMKWALDGIQVWFFPRSSIPDDITNDAPEPSNWGTPMANFPATDCSPYQFFYDHYNIFDTTLCGDWAGADAVWNYAGYAGQEQSCAAMTGYSTCSAYVRAQGSAFQDAYWEVAYVKYFNSTTEV